MNVFLQFPLWHCADPVEPLKILIAGFIVWFLILIKIRGATRWSIHRLKNWFMLDKIFEALCGVVLLWGFVGLHPKLRRPLLRNGETCISSNSVTCRSSSESSRALLGSTRRCQNHWKLTFFCLKLKFSSESLQGPRSLFCAIKTLKNKYVNFVAFDAFCKIIPGTAGHYGALSKQIGEQKPSRKQNLQKPAKTIWGTTGHYGTFSKNTRTSKTKKKKQSKMQNLQKPPGALRGTIQKHTKKKKHYVKTPKTSKSMKNPKLQKPPGTLRSTMRHYGTLSQKHKKQHRNPSKMQKLQKPPGALRGTMGHYPKTQKKNAKNTKNIEIHQKCKNCKNHPGHYGALWGTMGHYPKTQKNAKNTKNIEIHQKCKNCKNHPGHYGALWGTTGHYGALWGTMGHYPKIQKTQKNTKNIEIHQKCKNCKNHPGHYGALRGTMGYGTLSKNKKTQKKHQKHPKPSKAQNVQTIRGSIGHYPKTSKNWRKPTKLWHYVGRYSFSKKSRQDKTSISAAFVKVEAFLRIRMGTIGDYGVQSERAKTYVFAAVCAS